DFKVQSNALKLIARMLDSRTSTVPIVPRKRQKARFYPAAPSGTPLPRCASEVQGLRSRYIEDYLVELASDPIIHPQCVAIVRGGNMIAMAAVPPYLTDVWHATHSLCKSVTALAIGLLIDEGRLSLDSQLSEFFPEVRRPLSKLRPRADGVTVRELLNMSSGAVFNEAGAAVEEDWVSAFLETGLHFESGSEFSYNSMNSYMLSAIVKVVSGEGLSEYLKSRLFEPLGIEKCFWEKCPKGIEKGGFGMYLRIEDMAKLGLLVLRRGEWNGARIVSESWCEQMTSVQNKVPNETGRYDYGYQVWVDKDRNSFSFNGMFGQNVIVFPDSDIVVACTAGNDNMFQQSTFFDLTARYFACELPREPIMPAPFAHASLLRTCGLLGQPKKGRLVRSLSRRLGSKKLPKRCYALNGRRYIFEPVSSSAVGVLPLIVQLLQNTFTDGVRAISFKIFDDIFYVNIDEGEETHVFAVGFDDAEYGELEICAEPYYIAVKGTFTHDEDDTPVLKLTLSFLELPNVRTIKIFGDGDQITTEWSEVPGKNVITRGLSEIFGNSSGRAMNAIRQSVAAEYPPYKIDSVIEPVVRATRERNLD
ncbi:MAG: serine hydrolase, partial [Oscillospiraceae bacterium]